MTCSHRSILAASVVCVSLFLAAQALAEMPITGKPAPDLAVLDQEMTQFMQQHDISAGSLSVMKDGKMVLHHVYGWQDEQRKVPLREDAIFRVASVTKPFTAAAIRKLIAEGKFRLKTKVFRLPGSEEGLLELEPLGEPDPRLKDVTVDHLLHHRGGWNRKLAGDLTYQEKDIAKAFGVPSPPGRELTVRYIMGQPLQHDPGTKTAYSNIGYLLLGMIIEKVSGKTYQEYLQANVMDPAGIAPDAWTLGRSFKVDQDPREPYYDEPKMKDNVFYPDHNQESKVKAPYGSYDMEARTSQGRMVISGPAVLRFLDCYLVNGPNNGSPRPAPGTWKWNHGGSLPGTNTVARQRGDGVDFVVLFNKRPGKGSYATMMRERIDAMLDSGEVFGD